MGGNLALLAAFADGGMGGHDARSGRDLQTIDVGTVAAIIDVAQADDAYAAVLAEGQQGAIAGDDDIGASRHGALEDAIVRVVFQDLQPARRPYEGGELAQEHRDMGQLFGVAREFAREHAEELVEDGLGKDELVALLDDAAQGRLAVSAREYQRRDQDVGVEDDPQERK